MIMRGLVRLARGDAGFIKEFSSSVEGFSASLAPLIAFPLVGACLSALSGDWRNGLLGFLSRLCATLALPVLTHEFARLFGRTPLWLRAATALNWSFWLVLPAMLVGAVLGAILTAAGLAMLHAELAALALVGLYLLWNRWFVLRVGLDLSVWRAVLVLICSALVTILFTALPWAAGLPMPGTGLPASP